ncbi:alpha/beta hydrolase [Streptomyces canus]|uniref:alpha/beta hydrolase n=1 Tax=Streptomyces canus TaxID=58343 RepID=UPI00369D1B30
MTYEEIEFSTLDGATLRGRFYPPAGEGPYPAVILYTGIGGVAENLYDIADPFVEAGLAVFAYDHRSMGLSEGEPRQLIDPWRQSRDSRDAVTYLTSRADVDSDRIGLWGISLGGALSLFVAAVDKRVKAVVSIVPPVSGHSARTLFPPRELAELEELILDQRLAQLRGEPALLLKTNGRRDPDGPPVMFEDPEGVEFTDDFKTFDTYRNEIALLSLPNLFEFEPTAYAAQLELPVLLVTADEDTVAPVEDALEMYARVPEPKEHWSYPGQHYGILVRQYREIVARTAGWITPALIGD